MIELMFELGSEVVFVRIEGHKVLFGNASFGNQMTDISGLKLDYKGVCREFPDLEVRDDWKEEAVIRFKEKIKEMKTEDEVSNYIIDELTKHHYVPKSKRRDGFRPIQL